MAQADTLKQKHSLKRKARMRYLLGTLCSIEGYGSDDSQLSADIECAFTAMKTVEAQMSRFNPDSDIGRLNRLAYDAPIQVHPATYQVIRSALEIGSLTGGAFDPTLLPITQLWKQCEARNRMPHASELAHALHAINQDAVRLNADGTVVFTQPSVQLDLGGIGKGFAVDQAIDVLQGAGMTHGVVDAGGNLRVIGAPHSEVTWNIGVQHPLKAEELIASVELRDQAIATSGNYERGVRVGDEWLGHLIDPRTGYPVDKVLSVSVVASTAMLADALSSALAVLGLACADQVLHNWSDVSALFVVPQGDHLVCVAKGAPCNWKVMQDVADKA